MVTFSQIARGARVYLHRRTKSPRLRGCPQKRATCIRVYTISPKKPNSAVRKIAKVRLSTGQRTLVYLPGQGHSLQQHSVILIRGGRTPDCPGISYKAIRGKHDFTSRESFDRRTNRSKYGTPKPKKLFILLLCS